MPFRRGRRKTLGGGDPDGVFITVNPSNWYGDTAANATFTVTATSGNGSGLSYQWQEFSGSWSNLADGGRVSGATTATLTISTVQESDFGRQFRCVVTNDTNSRTSVGVALLDDDVVITGQPANWSDFEGEDASFTVTAISGDGSALTYQWQENDGGWSNISDSGAISGTDTPTLTISPAALADDAREFRCVVDNATDSQNSDSATMTVAKAGVTIDTQPTNDSAAEGGAVQFTVAATSGNSSGLSYQWQYNDGGWTNFVDGGSVSGATSDTLDINPVALADDTRQVRCIVTNNFDSATTNTVTITVSGGAETFFMLSEEGDRMLSEEGDYMLSEEAA